MTSWEHVHDWYDKEVGVKGHYFHEHLILPSLLKHLNKAESILDLACGQGVLSRHLPKKTTYVGIDLSKSLINAAKKYRPPSSHQFFVGDVTSSLPIEKKDFSHCVIQLAFQNIENGQEVLRNAHSHLQLGGKLFLILNHPCFRIPRQTSWGIDTQKKLQFRRIDRYLSFLKIPITLGKQMTYSFHHPLSTYTQWLHEAGFGIEWMEELTSNKKSSGKFSVMENRARSEFPLFLQIISFKR